jgi:hypothetical protein
VSAANGRGRQADGQNKKNNYYFFIILFSVHGPVMLLSKFRSSLFTITIFLEKFPFICTCHKKAVILHRKIVDTHDYGE